MLNVLFTSFHLSFLAVHHDTGYWVKHTHRVHVAIETGDMVDFKVGPNEENMNKMQFDEGRIVELNNQAKHSVSNKMTAARIHLIFDYVDDHPVNRILVAPNEKILQTRRSIDLERLVGSGPKCPSFIILGAQKSGTTSLYEVSTLCTLASCFALHCFALSCRYY